MKRYTRYVFSAIAVLATATMVACAKSSDSSTNYNNGFYIANPYGPGVSNAFFAQNDKMAQYIFPYDPAGANLTIQKSGYKALLKEAMGVCDRENTSYGTAACDAWADGFNDLVIYVYPNKSARLIIRSMPMNNCLYYSPGTSGYCSNYYASIPKFQDIILNIMGLPTGNMAGVFNPMVLEATYNLTNNSTGFTWRAKAPQGSRAYFQNIDIVIPTGAFTDNTHIFQLQYRGMPAGSGTLVRCQTANCGLNM